MRTRGSTRIRTARAYRTLAAKLLADLKREACFHPGDRVGVAVSGGADSVALLLLLLELRGELGVVLSVAHLNHKLRGRASDADAKFVAKLAADHDLPLHAETVDVKTKARREKANVEEVARHARQEFFAQLVAQGKVDRVASAHTADDQAETVLAHIFRGTGIAGLGGIHPETESVVRPLLHLRRAELRAYLRARKQKWREDATNQDTSRTRARIRKKLLPILEREFPLGVVEHLCALSAFAREDESCLDWLAAERNAVLVKKESRQARIAIAELLSPFTKEAFNAGFAESTERKKENDRPFDALTKRMLRRLIQERKTGKAQITAQHIGAVLELAQHGESGKTLQLPGRVDVRRERDELVFGSEEQRGSARKIAANRDAADYEYKIDLSSGTTSVRIPPRECVLRFRVIDWPTEREETKKSGAVLDRDRLGSFLTLRNWRPGDKLQPFGHQKAHKLKRLFNEKRISRWARRGWPVLTSDGVLVWTRGFPVAAGFAVSEGTRAAILIAEEKT